MMDERLEDYILLHSDAEPELLHRLYRATHIHTIHGRMASGHLQGRVLKMLVRMIRPQHILEVGTFSGYSALCMAEGLEAGGKVYTYEVNDEMEDFTRSWIAAAPYADKIDFRIGDALKEAPKLGISFDMVFLDGDKRTYAEAYDISMKLLRPGGYLVADNTLWDGHVVDPQYDGDAQTEGVRLLNRHIKEDPNVEKVILPLRDGLTIVRKNTP